MMRLALYPEQPVTEPGQSLTRLLGLLMGSALNNQPLLKLYQYMLRKYGVAPLEHFPHEDSNWIQSVVGLNVRPRDLNIVKLWTLT